ncbi:U3 snoRNA associated [Penicillium concentricum]|uniref:U3 snoRNA associated n=1 Tax=Penicillium concentricum TaxID=293559 RepID=A0A9W9VDU5_9EURO|nr:U3 snoRNA associated [Penicillium concentricum]KAJ5375746.1 U3 snoRNA associated [Penicillium concentricum]
MFAHLVTAAKGLFTRQPEEQESHSPGTSATNSKMVTATRRGNVAPEAASGKRKAQSANASKTEDQQTKRRRRSDPKATGTDQDATKHTPAEKSSVNGEKAPVNKKIRFGSEEPEPLETQPEETSETPIQDEDDEDDSDDDAPETIDNSAQQLKMKEQAKKQEVAKQLEEQLKREKRRKLDERRKLQAKSIVKPKEAPTDDMLSESTATLQGTTTQDARRAALPALLPDDILNAEFSIRPPTPPAEDEFAMPKKSNKLRFLDKQDKLPKDINMGDVSIRVLDAPSTKKSSKPALAPKISKAGRNLKGSMRQKTRTIAHGNGLRQKAAGPSGFVRR